MAEICSCVKCFKKYIDFNSFECIYKSITECVSFPQENVSLGARQGAQSGPVSAVLHRDGRHARGLQTLQVHLRLPREPNHL